MVDEETLCNGCKIPLHDSNGLECKFCKEWYHYSCVNSNIYYLILMDDPVYDYPMICPQCAAAKVDNLNDHYAAIRKKVNQEAEWIAHAKQAKPPAKSKQSKGSEKSLSDPGKAETKKAKKTEDKTEESHEPAPKDDEDAPERHPKFKTKICRFLRANNCKKGKNCPFIHPDLCAPFKANGNGPGGCTNKKCKLLHPIVCPGSWYRRECFMKQCKSFHLDRTQRDPKKRHTYAQVTGAKGMSLPQNNRQRGNQGFNASNDNNFVDVSGLGNFLGRMLGNFLQQYAVKGGG